MTEGGDGSARNFRSAYYEKLGFCGNDEKNYLDILIEASPFDSDKLIDLCERPELDRKCIKAWKVLLGVECDRKNPFDDYANVRRVRSEHFHVLKHHVEVLLKHNLLINKTRTASKQRVKHGQPVTPRDDQHSPCKELDQNQQHFHNERHQEQDRQNHHHQQTHENILKTQANADNARLITTMYLLETGKLDTGSIDGQLESEEGRKFLRMATFFVNVADDLQEAFFLFRNFTNRIQNKPNTSV